LSIPISDGEAAELQISEKTEIIQFSLRTRDPAVAKTRQVAALAHLEGVWQSLREGPKRLIHRQLVALSGEAYRRLTSTFEDDPGTPSRWEYFEQYIVHVGELIFRPPTSVPGMPTRTGQGLLDEILARHGLVLDEESVSALLHEYRKRLIEVAQRLRANASGDYRPDPNLERFPSINAEAASADAAGGVGPRLSFAELLEAWWAERSAAGTAKSTYTNYRGTLRHLAAFLKHDQAHQVRPEDIVAYKDHRLAEGRSIKTVKDTDLSALKSLFGWAVSNRKLSTDPTIGVKLKPGRTIVARQKWFSEEEARRILRGALTVERGQDTEKTWLAKRWAPWLMAYSGARVGEIAQLRKQDIQQIGGAWHMVITPEAGSVKTGKYRNVPLHPHLVELGFLEMVKARPDGYLFVDPKADRGTVPGTVSGLVNRLSEFGRRFVQGRGVSPNHGWRHYFINRAREHGMDTELRNMITGHTARDVAGKVYGGPAGLVREINKLPRISLEESKEQGLASGRAI